MRCADAQGARPSGVNDVTEGSATNGHAEGLPLPDGQRDVDQREGVARLTEQLARLTEQLDAERERSAQLERKLARGGVREEKQGREMAELNEANSRIAMLAFAQVRVARSGVWLGRVGAGVKLG